MASNINPAIWGAPAWIFLRNVAKGYPDKPSPLDKQNYKSFFESLANTLPCSKCRTNYKRHIREIPINSYLSNKNSLYGWVNKIKSKTKVDTRIARNTPVSDRILRIKRNRVERARDSKHCKGCGNRLKVFKCI